MTTERTEQVINRIAGAVARRVARTGESFEQATEAVIRDFVAEWPVVAAAMVGR